MINGIKYLIETVIEGTLVFVEVIDPDDFDKRCKSFHTGKEAMEYILGQHTIEESDFDED